MQNARVKTIRELLGRPRERRSAHAFIAEGSRLVEEALQANWPFQFVLAASDLGERGNALVHALTGHGVTVERTSIGVLQSLSETETSQGILAVLEQQVLPLPVKLSCSLVLDQVRDPGNLGTLLRTAAAAGVDAVLLPPETTDAFAPKVVRAGMGAHFRLPIQTMTWEEISRLATAQQAQVFLADMNGRSCWELDLQPPLMLIIGGEAQGAGGQARSLADERISIPMPGGSESLNAAVAGAILIFEIVRQRIGGAR